MDCLMKIYFNMKKFFSNLWSGIKRQLMMFLISTWYVWLAAILSVVAGLIFDWQVSILVFFGCVGAFILFIFLRQIYWWFTGKSDYEGGGFPKLWSRIMGK